MANEGYVFVMLVFFCVCFTLSFISRRLERRLRTGRPDRTRLEPVSAEAAMPLSALAGGAAGGGIARVMTAQPLLRLATPRLPFLPPAVVRLPSPALREKVPFALAKGG
jgi:hypothetical protein